MYSNVLQLRKDSFLHSLSRLSTSSSCPFLFSNWDFSVYKYSFRKMFIQSEYLPEAVYGDKAWYLTICKRWVCDSTSECNRLFQQWSRVIKKESSLYPLKSVWNNRETVSNHIYNLAVYKNWTQRMHTNLIQINNKVHSLNH